MSSRRLSCEIVVLLLLPLLSFSTPAANISLTVTTFGDGSREKELTFPAAGSLSNANLSLQTGLLIDNATFKVQGSSLAGPSTSYPFNVTIDVGDDGDTEWEFKGTGYGELGHQTVFSNGKNRLNLTFPSNGGSNTTGSIRLPKSAHVNSAEMNVTSGGALGGSGKILLCHSDNANWAADVQTKLKSFTDVVQVDIGAQGATPTLDTMKQYAVVYVWANGGFADAVGLGNNLADYVDVGGGVVLATFVTNGGTQGPSGRFITGGYQVIPYSGSSWSAGQLGTVYLPNHPLMTNVNTFTTTAYRSGTNTVTSGSVRVADFTDGNVLAACKDVNGVMRVDLGFFPPSADVAGSGWSTATDGKQLMHNAVCFAGRKALNCSLDILNDNQVEWKNETFNSSAKIPDFSALLNNYLATAPPNGTDAFGNQYVDIPLSVSANSSGMLALCNLSITYDYTATVDINPNLGNLTNKLNELMPKDLGTTNFSIPIKVTTETAGKLKLLGLNITAHPPQHLPDIVSVTPSGDTQIFENSSLDMEIIGSDMYRNPLTYQWFRNGSAVPGATGTTYKFTTDYESMGKHVVKAVIDNGLGNVSYTWNISVKNVNRPPFVVSFFPPGDTSIKENSSLEFRVNASDPDRDTLRYAWFVNNDEKLGISTNFFLFTTDFSSAGIYDVRARVMDPGGLSANLSWKLTVSNVNVPPKIDSYNPRSNPRIKEMESMTFSIVASDYDKQALTYRWYFNETEAGTSTQYVYKSDYESAGNYSVRVVVSDGELTDSHSWTLQVDNVNRPPIPVIDSPKDPLEFMNTENVKFSAKSSRDPDGDTLKFRWSEAGKDLSTQPEFEKKFPPGDHEVALEVSDGNGGINTTSVRFTVHFIELSGVLSTDKPTPTQDDIVTLTAEITNSGDVSAEALSLEFLVDNKSVEKKSLASVGPGSTEKATFQWKAQKGSHVLTVRIATQSWDKTVDAKAKFISLGGGGDSSWLWLLIAVVAIVAVASTGAFIYARRKKKKREEQAAFPAPSAAPSPYTQAPAAPAPYTPVNAQAPAPSPAPYTPVATPEYGSGAYPPTPAYGAAPAATQPQAYGQPVQSQPPAPAPSYYEAPSAPVSYGTGQAGYGAAPGAGAGYATTTVGAGAAQAPMEDDAKRMQKKALRIMTQVTELVNSIEAGGIDVSEARRALDLARSFLKADNSTKAIQYAKKADSLARDKRERVKSERAGGPACKTCGAPMEASWKACPKCGSKH